MPDKLKSSKSASKSEVETETEETQDTQAAAATGAGAGVLSAARKIYPIVKYGDPILEKPTGLVKKFDEELEQLAEDMFASMYAAQALGWRRRKLGWECGWRLSM